MAASTNGNGQSEESQSATRLEFFAPAGGLRVDGKTYREGDRIPAKYGRAIASGETPKDPAWNSALAPPNLGRTVIPNIYTYASRQSLIAKIYRNPDEAMRHSVTNARAMTRDLVVWGCIEARQRGTVLLDWHLETEDKNDPQQKQLVEELTRIVSATPGFTEYRRNLMDAIWYGRAGIQHEYGFQHRTGKRYTVLKGWKPINGDKLLFRYDDGSGRYDPDQVGIKTSFVHPAFDAPAGNRVVETTDQGAGYFLEKWERSLWAIHKHTIEDGLHEDILSAGRVHGVGIRDRIYWQWFQRQNALAMLMELVERTGNGFTVYYYQYGNPEAKAAMTDIAKNHGYNNNILIPRMAGDPSMDANGIEVIPANVGGIDALKELIDGFFDEQTVRYILGQTLTTRASSTGLGSGLADLHQESFIQIVKYDARKLEETITNELIEPLKKFNFPWAREIPVYFRIDTEGTEPEQKLAAVKSGWEMGLKIKSDDVYGMLGISKPTEEDEVLENPQLAQAAAQVMHETRLGQGADDGGGDDGQGYDPQNLEHLFGPALKAAGVDSQPSDNGDDQQQPTRFARARYAVTHAPEGGSSGGGKEYKGGQFQPQDAAAKGKQADPNAAAKPVKATATQAAREAGMLKHGFIDQPITDADRGQLWAMARANLGNDSSLPPEMRGMFVTLQMMKETQQMGVVTTDKIDPKIAQGIYQWMQSNAGQDAGGGHVRDLGNGKLGFSAKSGALILAPAGGGKFNATYTPMTHVVRSAGDVGGKAPDQQAFDFANQEQGDGFGPELGAEEMQIESDPVADDYGQELGPDEMQIEDIDGDAIEAEANGVEPDGQRGQSSSREPGDDSDEDADPDDSGFGPQPKTSGPTAQSKSLSKRSEIGKSIMAAAAEYGVDEDELNKAVEHTWNMHREAHAQHEEAMTAVRKWFGYTQRDIHRWENQGKDYSSIKGFDVIAREVAKAYPELGLGKGRDDTKEDEGLDEALWNALKEGKRTLPTRQEVVGEAAEWLSRSKREREREQRRQREELAAVPFKKRLTEYFVAKYGGKKFKPAAGQGGFDFDAPAPKPAAASTSASTSSGPLTDANGHLHAPKGGATVNGKDFEGGEYIPPGDIAAASDEEKADLQAKQSAAIGESLKKATGSTNLFGDEVRDKPKPATFENAKGKQGKMFSGMDALPGQTDLFEDMDNVNAVDDEPEPEAKPAPAATESAPSVESRVQEISGDEDLPEAEEDADEGAPWKMTEKEWAAQGGSRGDYNRAMREALRAGKDVPDHVIDAAGDNVWRAHKAVYDWERESLTPDQRRIREAKPATLMEDDYLEQKRLSKIAAYLGGIPQLESQLKGKMSGKQRMTSEASLAFWREDLEKYLAMPHGAHDSNRNAASWRREYEKMIRDGISKGQITDSAIINQRPEFKTAIDARRRYEKGLHTSFANKSIAVDSSMRAERGYKAKRQDGKEMTDKHRQDISRGVDEVEKVLGPIRDLLDHTDLTISHTSGKHPFLSTAAGLYSILEKTVTTGFASKMTGRPQAVLAHELAHWLDYEAGHAAGKSNREKLGTKVHILSALSTDDHRSGDPEARQLLNEARMRINDTMQVRRMFKTRKDAQDATPEERDQMDTLKVALGPYWTSSHEIFARLVEQYISDELGDQGGNAAEKDYTNQPGWWRKADFAKFKPAIKNQIDRRLNILRTAIAAKGSGNG